MFAEPNCPNCVWYKLDYLAAFPGDLINWPSLMYDDFRTYASRGMCGV